MINKNIVRRQPKVNVQYDGIDSQLVTRILQNRGVASSADVDYSLTNLLHFEKLKDIALAADIVFKFIQEQKNILIVGDFDADGATSCALAILGLKALGAKCVDYLVPNRFEYGYGLSPELVTVAQEKSPDIIITVDNGISSIEGVRAAKALGIDVIITDHHLAGENLPGADAIVNPNQPDDEFESKSLAGVGVMFYLLLALRHRMLEDKWFEKESIAMPNLAHYLDLVALGTVADLVPLDTNNRILVAQGLKLIRASRCRVGIQALLEVNKKLASKVRSSDLGFSIGPRLNAAGRLDDMSLGIECLLANDKETAMEYADILHSLNSDRQQVEKSMQHDAMQKLARLNISENLKASQNTVSLYQDDWHQGVVGLLASRIKDKVNRPCVVFANADEFSLKASARSVKQIHIRDALALVDARYPDVIDKFGGHAMAAGLSLHKKNLPAFIDAFEAVVTEMLGGQSFENDILSDGNLSAHDFTIETAEVIQRYGPFGQRFPEPKFDGEFRVLEQRIVGENHLKLSLKVAGLDKPVAAIAFRVDTQLWLDKAESIRAVYSLDINDYFNIPELQLIIDYIERL